MDVFDKLILPSLFTDSASSHSVMDQNLASSSSDTIKKCLYRKLFSDYAQAELMLLNKESLSIDEILHLVFKISTDAGFFIL